jgi:hypothetical protein
MNHVPARITSVLAAHFAFCLAVFLSSGFASHLAVPYFSGCIGDSLDNFLQEYKELASACWLSNQQKCDMVLHYIAPSLCDLWKSLDEFHFLDWASF